MSKLRWVGLVLGLILVVGCDVLPQAPTPLPLRPTLQVEPLIVTATAVPVAGQNEAGGRGDDGGVEEVPDDREGEPVETPTLAPTITPSPTPLGTPETLPPLEAADVNNLPATERDLLFVADGSLKLWTAHNRQISELMGGGVTHMAISADGNRVVVARLLSDLSLSSGDGEPLPVVMDGDSADNGLMRYTEHEIIWIDVVSKEQWVIAPRIALLHSLAVSPDQRYISLTGLDVSAVPLTIDDVEDEAMLFPGIKLYLASPPTSGIREIGACQDLCGRMSWRQDSTLFAYSDRAGMWLFDVNNTQPQQVMEQGVDAQPYQPQQLPLGWASNGRALLYRWAGPAAPYAIRDFAGPAPQLPYAFASSGEPRLVSAAWLADSRLLVMSSVVGDELLSDTGASDGVQNPFGLDQTRLEIWKYEPGGVMSLDEGIVLAPGNGVLGSTAVQLQDGRFAYALLHPWDATVSALYIRDSLAAQAVRLNGLPTGRYDLSIIWAMDGRDVLVLQSGGAVYYAQPEGGLFDMTAVMGPNVSDAVWLRPSGALR